MKKNDLRPLAYYGAPILRKKAAEILEITPEIQSLAREMIELLDPLNGIGLAAPQIHISKALFVTCAPVEETPENWETCHPRAFINPKILSYSSETWQRDEGCLSIPGIHDTVTRARTIELRYQNLEGTLLTESFEGMLARVIQHEYDHLQGILFIDRLNAKRKKAHKEALMAIKRALS